MYIQTLPQRKGCTRQSYNFEKGMKGMEKMTLYSPEEVAEMLGVTPNAVRGWLRDGVMPAFKFGKVWRIKEADLEAFVEKSRVDVKEG